MHVNNYQGVHRGKLGRLLEREMWKVKRLNDKYIYTDNALPVNV